MTWAWGLCIKPTRIQVRSEPRPSIASLPPKGHRTPCPHRVPRTKCRGSLLFGQTQASTSNSSTGLRARLLHTWRRKAAWHREPRNPSKDRLCAQTPRSQEQPEQGPVLSGIPRQWEEVGPPGRGTFFFPDPHASPQFTEKPTSTNTLPLGVGSLQDIKT